MSKTKESAKGLREQARKLLEQAEAIDGKKPFLLVCVSDSFEEPTSTVVYAKKELTKAQAAAEMGFERAAAVEGSGYNISVRELTLQDVTAH